jgi:hypothetical protein
MKTKYTAEDVARMMGAPLAAVKSLYAKNAASLRSDADKAAKSKTGKLRGLTAQWYQAGAEHAEAQSK